MGKCSLDSIVREPSAYESREVAGERPRACTCVAILEASI